MWCVLLASRSLHRAYNPRDSEGIVKQMQDSLAVLSPELVPVHQRLVILRRQLATLVAKGGSHKAELKPIQEELRKIDSLSTSLLHQVCLYLLLS